ncbi:MAG: NAD(P)H-hydrate epimerase, partial [Alphaproteobacteria bacterium]
MSAETELLTVEEMYRADALTIEGGVSGAELMEKAGVRVVALITAKWERGRVLILCGPGNNGGDGYVAARLLKEAGWQVDLVAIGDPKMLKGDAAVMRDRWGGAIDTPAAADPEQANLVIDAVFGAGLTRALEEPVVSLFRKVREAGLPVIAVDMPSGVNGNDGTADAATLSASYTVTFFRGKPGHFLYPGRGFCGELLITDIGIEAGVLRKIAPKTSRNDPALWRDLMPRADALGHKYSRGHAAVTGGGVASTGAARLSARAALRSGAGAVTLITPFSALMVYASALTAVMVRACGEPSDFAAWIREKRIGVVLLGPGNGVSDRTRGFVEAALESNADVLLDADALTVLK